ncbi:MAG: DUF3772 domain-containing protein, partial [Actinomycetospora chiangmaiensis]|nr:DUF3772 domain-containing protein [Actinomycetospora chiangmaiensis]
MLFSPVRVFTPHGPRRFQVAPLLTLSALAALLSFASPGPAGAQQAAPPAAAPIPQAKPAETKAAPANGAAKPADPKPAEVKPPVPQPELSEQFKAARAKLDHAKTELDHFEKELGRTDLTATDLTTIRDAVAAQADEVRTIVSHLDAPLAAARERLTQLGPKPKEGEESGDVAQQRAEREAVVNRIDETQRLARSLVVQGDQLIDRVSNRRRASFTRDLFHRTQPLLSPGLWAKVMADIPRDTRSLQSAVEDIGVLFGRNGSIGNLLMLGLAFGVSVALYFGRRNIAPRAARRDENKTEPSRRATLLGAWRVILVGTVPAVAGSYAVYYALDATDLLPSRLLPVAAAILTGLAFIAAVEAL